MFCGGIIYIHARPHTSPQTDIRTPRGASNCLILRTFSVLTWIMVEVLVSNLFRIRMLQQKCFLMHTPHIATWFYTGLAKCWTIPIPPFTHISPPFLRYLHLVPQSP